MIIKVNDVNTCPFCSNLLSVNFGIDWNRKECHHKDNTGFCIGSSPSNAYAAWIEYRFDDKQFIFNIDHNNTEIIKILGWKCLLQINKIIIIPDLYDVKAIHSKMKMLLAFL